MFSCRECDGSFFLPVGEVRRCVDQCAEQTMCGTVVIPEDHLKVSFFPYKCLWIPLVNFSTRCYNPSASSLLKVMFFGL